MAKLRRNKGPKRQRKQLKQPLQFEALELRRMLSTTPPTIEEVLISSDAWTSNFQTELSNQGFGDGG